MAYLAFLCVLVGQLCLFESLEPTPDMRLHGLEADSEHLRDLWQRHVIDVSQPPDRPALFTEAVDEGVVDRPPLVVRIGVRRIVPRRLLRPELVRQLCVEMGAG